jgi:iron complex transport system substrate-binding protein
VARRQWGAWMAVAVLAASGLAACGGDDGAAGSDEAPADGDTGAAEAFPVTIEHKYGETVIEEAPERVVSVGFTDQDFLLALDVVPVGIRDWYGDQPHAVWPWAQDELGDAEPEVLSADELNFEAVAALQPDLIVGVSSGMTAEEYETLSAIAPTLAQSDEYVDYGVPWQAATRAIGEAVGKADEAEALVEEVEGLFTAARAEHPEFEGASGIVAFVMDANEVGGYSDQDTRSRLLTDLGFEIPQEIIDLAGDSFYASFSGENIERLDADLVVWVAGDDEVLAQIKASPLRDALRAVTEGREVFLDVEIGGAAGFSSPLSLPYLLEELVPRFAAAVDGDPATPAE